MNAETFLLGDEVNATNLLEELGGHAEGSTLEVLREATVEQLTHLETTAGALNLKGLLNVVQLHVDLNIAIVQVKQTSSNVAGLGESALHDQPTRGFRQVEQAPDDKEREEDLESDRESVGARENARESAQAGTLRHPELDRPPANRTFEPEKAVVDPVTDHNATRDKSAGKGDKNAALLGAGTFRLPGGDRRGNHAIANATNNTTSDKGTVAIGSSLEDGADDHDPGAPESTGATTPAFTVE